MKLQAIKKRCLSNKRFIIIEAGDGSQLLSDGVNAYRIIGIRLQESSMQDVFDLSDKQASSCIFTTKTTADDIYTNRGAPFRVPLDYMGTIWAYEQKVTALRTVDGLVYVPEDAIAAAGHNDYVPYLVQDSRGVPRIAIYHGIFCDALLGLVPGDVAWAISDKLTRIGSIPILNNAPEKEVTHDEEAVSV